MSSVGSSTNVSVKKRRITRACDYCRRRKSKCNGPSNPGSRCSTCVMFSAECTYDDAVHKRGPRRKSQTRDLEQSPVTHGGAYRNERSEASSISDTSATSSPFVSTSIQDSATPPKQPLRSPSPFSDELSEAEEHGPPLYEMFAKLDLKKGPVANPSGMHHLFRSSEKLSKSFSTKAARDEWHQKNPWTYDPWEIENQTAAEDLLNSRHFNFPEPDLLSVLVDAYFIHFNAYYPLLHRPTFEYNLAEQAHHRDSGFGAVVLAVCALGAKYVDDPRVYLPGCPSRSAGWYWYNQLQIFRRPFLHKPQLSDVQLYILAVMFQTGSSKGQSIWFLIGIAQRLLLEVGANMQRFYSKTPNPRDELWKRAFWVALCLDRMVSTDLGRPTLLREDDYDTPLPIDCDDEYWIPSDSAQAFVQPAGKPSSLTFFLHFISLQKIRAFAMQNLFSVRALASLPNQDIVAQIDSNLNEWLDSLPDILRWDPKKEDTLFFHQSAMLYTDLSSLQVVIHRPSASSRTPSLASLTSLAICTNAARSCSHILAIQITRPRAPVHSIHVVGRSLNTAVMLSWTTLVNHHSKVNVDFKSDQQDIQKCLDVVKICATKSLTAKHTLTKILRFAVPKPLLEPGAERTSTKRQLDDAAGPAFAGTSNEVLTSCHPLPFDPSAFVLPNGSNSSERCAPINIAPPPIPLPPPVGLAPGTGHTADSSYHGVYPDTQIRLDENFTEGEHQQATVLGDPPGPVQNDLFNMWADGLPNFGIFDWTSYLEDAWNGNASLAGTTLADENAITNPSSTW